jgi:hypothetical protein
MATAPAASRGFFPLDKELALLPGQLTPLLQDHLAHLGTWMPFAKAAEMLKRFTQASVSASTAQRHTETIGLAYEAVQLAEVEQIERDWPAVPAGPEKMLLSVDGAFVPVLHGEWAEVKTLVVGEVGEPHELKGERVVPTINLSYFSRLSEAEAFQRLTLGELHRRGLETASQVAVVSDGAEWIQGFADYHCPEALRILDFAHAAERICQIGEVVLGSGHASLAAWQQRQLHQLKRTGPSELVASLRSLAKQHLSDERVAGNLAYLEKREEQLAYARFQGLGWPIGSGIVESANKVVVEARLKGAGRHWARASVNPLLSLRNAVCNDRWDEAWQQSTAHIRCAGVVRRAVQPKQVQVSEPAAPPALPVPPVVSEGVPDGIVRRKPSANHPWRRTNYATKARMAQVSG